ncbi:putative late blight resistance protein homolog R1B-23 [Salvia hispanica]|uniref:putative late blight resistance protein homolog R1B-23 n=1 Tax=Salvia hispanica TaxID=49212 RepID=UPI0020096410|nr:putative late blight resistance protein homolog R1B-23 [Salvia hispanica]
MPAPALPPPAPPARSSLHHLLLDLPHRPLPPLTRFGRSLVAEVDEAYMHFPDKEIIREVANTSEEIIQYLFSPQNLSADCGSTEPSVRLSDQLGELAEDLDSTVGYVVDYCKINDHSVRQQSNVAVGFGEDVTDSTVATSSRPAPTTKCFAPDFDEDPSASPSLYPPTSRDDVVGFDEDILRMINLITDNSYSNREILPIVGIGGIGKSTLDKSIYHHPLIVDQFDIRAWVTISQDYTMKNILSQLLASLNRKVHQVGRGSLIVIKAEKLEVYKILLGRRYLIIMDDMWSTEAWDHVQRLFPNNHNGSRIILTTRLMAVATYAATGQKIHMMRFLDDEQSWRLFHHKVFGDQDSPHELRSVGEKIIKGCGGLPLSIVNVAGLLSRIPRTPKLWQQIEVNDGQLGSILSLSYNHLPPHLRKCFLYMAVFPPDYDIRASELFKLWAAEGFIERRNESESLELVAEECLEDLIKQSLVLITSRKIDGKIKSCRLHSMVRDFCVRQAGREKFLLSVMDYFPTPILRRHFLPQVLQNHHRVSVSWHDLHLKDSTHSSCTTSIICIPQRGYRPKGSVENFTSLRVLHVLRRNDHSYWELGQVFELINLTYLASNIPDSIVPPAIAKLQNLQTLIIYKSDVRLPEEIWRLSQLRHLIAFSFYPLPFPKGETPLKNLQTLSIAKSFVCSQRMAGLIPNIRKLGICYSEEDFGAGDNLYKAMNIFRLEKLKLKMYSSSVPHPWRLRFYSRLKMLELSGGWIHWRDMTIVGPLPKLQVLKLKNYACYGEHWETIDEEFHDLILLLIDESNLKFWRTKWTHFPSLKCLMLHRCPYLDEIPRDIGTIPSLELIEIDDHNFALGK